MVATLPYRTLPYPTRSYPTLPYPTLPGRGREGGLAALQGKQAERGGRRRDGDLEGKGPKGQKPSFGRSLGYKGEVGSAGEVGRTSQALHPNHPPDPLTAKRKAGPVRGLAAAQSYMLLLPWVAVPFVSQPPLAMA